MDPKSNFQIGVSVESPSEGEVGPCHPAFQTRAGCLACPFSTGSNVCMPLDRGRIFDMKAYEQWLAANPERTVMNTPRCIDLDCNR
jgi:hypothetical protein